MADAAQDAPQPTTATELIAALTLAEKVAMLHQAAPAVERLGLSAFRTGTEALHGVSWLGAATVFPQPVGLAATWDPDVLRRLGDAVATEVRAKHAADPTVSLNVWAPVVNPLRHPLWGRTEEGYSEDPDLTAALATGYVRGLRGDDPCVWKTVPTLKHFLAYSNETDRAVTSSHLPPQALREYELPAFTGPLASGAVGAVMPSYNLVNGRPNHVARELLDEMRSWAPAPIAVVSDAQAPSNIVDGERYHDDHVASHAAALRAGIDSFTDNDTNTAPTIERFTAALAAGLVTEADVDRAVLRLLQLRERTGELAGSDPYAVPATAIDIPEHRALARDAVARSVVVLANDRVLPLTEPARIAVVGPFADHVVHDWYSGTPTYLSTIASALAERFPTADVRVASGADRVALRSLTHDRYLEVTPDGAALTASATEVSDRAPLDVTDWGAGTLTLRSVATGLLLSGQSWIVAPTASRVGGWVAQESFHATRHDDGSVSLQHLGSGKFLRVQHGSHLLVADGTASTAERFALTTLRTGLDDVADACADADVAVVALGNDPHLLGRETEDRPGLGLPQAATAIWDAARRRAARAVLTIVSSYPYAVADEAADAAAVVWISHGGQELGHGLVDVLSGDHEPSGRLAQTWWRSASDAGDLLEYDVVGAGMTYRYADATPLFGLGHGLTYSTVRYGSLHLSRSEVPAPPPSTVHTPAGFVNRDAPAPQSDRTVTATVTVHNAGDRPAHELVAVWACAPELDVPAPRVRLAAWTRVVLEPGETAQVALPVDVGILAVWDVAATPAPSTSTTPDVTHSTPGAFRVQGATYALASGGSAADLTVSADLTVTAPAAPVRRAAVVPAHAFHAADHAVTSDRTREAGSSVELAPRAEEGWVRYDRLDLAGLQGVRLELTHRALPARSPARVQLEVRPAEGGAWLPLTAALDVPSAQRYAWTGYAVPVTKADDVAGVLAGPVDVRVLLTGAARLAEVAFMR